MRPFHIKKTPTTCIEVLMCTQVKKMRTKSLVPRLASLSLIAIRVNTYSYCPLYGSTTVVEALRRNLPKVHHVREHAAALQHEAITSREDHHKLLRMSPSETEGMCFENSLVIPSIFVTSKCCVTFSQGVTTRYRSQAFISAKLYTCALSSFI
jgi:hypothetical protein